MKIPGGIFLRLEGRGRNTTCWPAQFDSNIPSPLKICRDHRDSNRGLVDVGLGGSVTCWPLPV